MARPSWHRPRRNAGRGNGVARVQVRLIPAEHQELINVCVEGELAMAEVLRAGLVELGETAARLGISTAEYVSRRLARWGTPPWDTHPIRVTAGNARWSEPSNGEEKQEQPAPLPPVTPHDE